MSKKKAKKMTKSLLDSAVDRVIIEHKQDGFEFTLQDINRLKQKHAYDKADIEKDAAAKEKKENNEMFWKIMDADFDPNKPLFNYKPGLKPSANFESDASQEFSDGYDAGYQEGKRDAEREWRAMAQDTIGMMTMFFGELPRRKDQ